MNIQLKNAHREASLVDTADLSELCDRIRTLADTLGNYDTLREEAALEAHQRGRAAYWTTALYHNQTGLLVALVANGKGLAYALDTYADDSYPSPSRQRASLLAQLIPLNDKARAEKAKLVRDDVASKGRVA
jgi:hypothetical protein